MKISLNNKKLHLIIILIITSIVYINILQNDFIWDDSSFIEGWYETRALNINSFFKGSVPIGQEGVYRPLRSVFYALSYKLWHLNPIGYHFQSIIIHLISTILIYFITIKITKRKVIAFMTSILFGVHPVHTESITFITTSFDVIGVVFFLISFYLYLKFIDDKNKINYVFSILFALFAFFTYEMTLTLPLLIILYDFCFKRIKKRNIIKKVKTYLPYFISALFYLFIRVFILNIGSRGDYIANSFYLTMLTMTKAFVKYISLLFFPINLNTDHIISKGIMSLAYASLNEKAALQSIFNLNIIFSIAIISLILIIAIKSFRKYPIISFCIGWFFISLSPISNIIPQAAILAEKYLYIASFGFCLLFSFIIHSIYNLTRKIRYIKTALILFFLLTTIFYSSLTIYRNQDWKDSLTLWSKTVSQSPDSVVAHNNLGKAYHQQGNLDLAIDEYKKTIILNPNSTETYNNLGAVYHIQGKIELAIQEYEKSLSINPNHAETHNNLGTAYYSLGKIDLAVEEHKKSIVLNPNNPESFYNLGNAYHEQGKINLAIQAYKKVFSINPNHAETHNNLGIIYHEQGKIELAIQEYEKAISINPDHADAINNLEIAKQISK